MDRIALIIVIAAAALVLGVALVIVARVRARSRRAALRSQFGEDYDRVIEQRGQSRGERELRARLQRRGALDIRELDGSEREQYGRAWQSAQSTFVEKPNTGLHDAERLIEQVMRDRGYPVEHFEERAKMVSVDHPDLVERYRSAHRTSVAVEDGGSDGGSDTESMRQAMVDHRYLFDAMLQGGDATRTRRV